MGRVDDGDGRGCCKSWGIVRFTKSTVERIHAHSFGTPATYTSSARPELVGRATVLRGRTHVCQLGGDDIWRNDAFLVSGGRRAGWVASDMLVSPCTPWTDNGRQRLVRHGHLPEREIMNRCRGATGEARSAPSQGTEVCAQEGAVEAHEGLIDGLNGSAGCQTDGVFSGSAWRFDRSRVPGREHLTGSAAVKGKSSRAGTFFI